MIEKSPHFSRSKTQGVFDNCPRALGYSKPRIRVRRIPAAVQVSPV